MTTPRNSPAGNPTGQMTPKQVDDLHRNDDVNKRKESHHHTIGLGPNEVAAGRHFHDGTDSPQLLEGVVITGSRTTDMANIMNQLLNALGPMGLGNATSP